MKNRFVWLDIMKGFTIFLVVFGHVFKSFGLLNTSIFQWIQTYYMAFFFMLSGFLAWNTLRKSAMTILKNKVRSLLIPFIVCGSAYSLSFNEFHDYIWQFFHAGYWFLLSLFCCWLFFLVLQKILVTLKVRRLFIVELVIMIIPFVGGQFLMKSISQEMIEIFSLNMTISFYRFFILGYFLGKIYNGQYNLNKTIQKLFTNKNLLLAMSFLIFVTMSLLMISDKKLLSVIPVTVIQLMMCLSLFGTLYFSESFMKPYMVKSLSWWGKCSLEIYVLHFFIVSHFTIDSIRNFSIGFQILIAFLISILTIFVTLGIASPISNNKYLAYIILGQRKK